MTFPSLTNGPVRFPQKALQASHELIRGLNIATSEREWWPSRPYGDGRGNRRSGDLRVHDPDGDWESDSASQEPRELTFVDEDTFWATF